MIIRADIADFDVGRILIDAFNALGIEHQQVNKDITLSFELLR